MARRTRLPIRVLLILVPLALGAGWLALDHLRSGPDAPRGRALPPVAAEAVRVVDGDSLEFDGTRVRLSGIDALELRQTCRDATGAGVACGRAARDALAALVRDGPLRCTAQGADRFGRSLAVCTNGRGEEINRTLVREGWALAYPGDDAYRAEERAAAAARRGVHAFEFTPPQEWRRMHRQGGAGQPAPS